MEELLKHGVVNMVIGERTVAILVFGVMEGVQVHGCQNAWRHYLVVHGIIVAKQIITVEEFIMMVHFIVIMIIFGGEKRDLQHPTKQ